jgi:putative phosphoesterase
MKIGIISDTHGYIHPKVFSIFNEVDLILHAGDIGSEDVITSLETLAPVKAIHGNVDTFPLSTRYPGILALDIQGIGICMIHQFFGLKSPKIQEAARKLGKKKIDVLIYGHTHQAKLERAKEVFLFNPGSAGKRRFSLRLSVGLLTISEHQHCLPEIIYLE